MAVDGAAAAVTAGALPKEKAAPDAGTEAAAGAEAAAGVVDTGARLKPARMARKTEIC